MSDKNTTEIRLKPWGFEVWQKDYDEKGKLLREWQRGAAVCGSEPKDIGAAMRLMGV